MDILKEHFRINSLLDFYQSLLTDKQRKVMEYYYVENLSLTEISELLGISRNGVHDHLKRTVKLLENYEAKLQLLAKFTKRMNLYQKLKAVEEKAEILSLLDELERLE